MMVGIMINDGYNANTKLKIIYLVVEIIFSIMYFLEAVSKTSQASFDIFSSGYSIC